MLEANFNADAVTQFTSRFTGELPVNKVDFQLKVGLTEQRRQEQNDERFRSMQKSWLKSPSSSTQNISTLVRASANDFVIEANEMPTSNDIGLFHQQMNKNSANTTLILDTFGNQLMVAMVQASSSKLFNLIAGVKALGLTGEQLKQICQSAAERIPAFKGKETLIPLKIQELFTLVKEGFEVVKLPVEPPNLYPTIAVIGYSDPIVPSTADVENFDVGKFVHQLSKYIAQYGGDFVVPADQRDSLRTRISIAEGRIDQLMQGPHEK